MLIKIIKGTYGYYDGVSVEAKTSASPAFELNDQRARQLIAQNVAQAVEMPTTTSLPAGDAPEYTPQTKLADLKTLASEKYGMDCSSMTAKSKVIAAIEEAKAAALAEESTTDDEDDESIDDGEAPPDLNAAEPV